jgi:hypothetical protein
MSMVENLRIIKTNYKLDEDLTLRAKALSKL